jgi:hypothetical protein
LRNGCGRLRFSFTDHGINSPLQMLTSSCSGQGHSWPAWGSTPQQMYHFSVQTHFIIVMHIRTISSPGCFARKKLQWSTEIDALPLCLHLYLSHVPAASSRRIRHRGCCTCSDNEVRLKCELLPQYFLILWYIQDTLIRHANASIPLTSD